MASLQSIAREAGVSKQTVSRAFRNHPYVKSDLREKIFAAATRQGYRPDPALARLMSHLRQERGLRRRETIAITHYNYTRAESDKRAPIQSLLAGIRKFADDQGFHPEEFWLSDKGMTGTRLSRIFRARGIQGVIVMPVNLRSHGHLSFDAEEFSTVALGVGLLTRYANRVHHDHYRAMTTVLRELRHLGYRRIGMLCSAVLNERSHRTYEAAFYTFHPLPPPARHALFRTYLNESPARLRSWIQDAGLEVLITDLPHPARWLEKDGTPFPGTMPLIPMDLGDDQESAGGIVQDYRQIGETAMRLLAARLVQHDKGKAATPMVVRHEGHWINRGIPRAKPTALGRRSASKAAAAGPPPTPNRRKKSSPL